MTLKTWQKTWGMLAVKLLAIFGSLASLISLLAPLLPAPKDLHWWTIIILGIAAILSLLVVVLEIFDHRRRRVYARSDTEGIKKYMHEWIEHGGRIAIWTRDMSWAHNDDTRKLLMLKADRAELILCLPEQNEFTKKLAAAGAEVCAYGATRLESPASRFTVTSFGKDGARVAIGRPDGDVHVIEEFNANGNPAFHLADDLIALVRALCKGAK